MGHGLCSTFILYCIYLAYISRWQNLALCVCVCALLILIKSELEIRNKTSSCFILYLPMKQPFHENYIFVLQINLSLFLLHLFAMSVNLSHTSLTMLSINCLHNNNTVKLRFGPKKAHSQVGHRWNAKQVCLKKSEWREECNTALKCQLLEMYNLWLSYTAGALTL